MKLTIFKGLANDLAASLNLDCMLGRLEEIDPDISYPIQKTIINPKDKLEEYFLNFIKERTPKKFDLKRLKHLKINIIRSAMDISVAVEIKIDDKLFLGQEGTNYI